MKTKQQLNTEIAKLQEQLEILEEQEKAKDFTTIKHKGKEFRLYIWEDKPIGNLKIKGYELAEFQDVIELYDEDKLVLEVWKPVFVKHFSKKEQIKEFCLSGLCLDGGLGLSSNVDSLANSYEDIRVLLKKVGK